MNWKAIAFDWNQVRAFLVTAEEGSLSSAARALGLTQPTLGRQVTALEETLGLTLFDRVGRSLVLTPAGAELLTHVREMGEAAHGVSRVASGQSRAIEGPVSITASDVMSAEILPPIVAEIRGIAPGIEVTIVAANDIRDIARREADIAIRHVRPDQPDLIAKALPKFHGSLFAASSFLDRFGRPKTIDDLQGAPWVGYENPEQMIAFLAGLGIEVERHQIGVITGNGLVLNEMVRQGIGFAVMWTEVMGAHPDLEPVLPDLPPFAFDTWLTTHRELHTSRRIRLVYDLLAQRIAEYAANSEKAPSRALGA